MAIVQQRAPGRALLLRGGRFLYLLWGGMLLMRNTSFGRLQFPVWVWERPGLAIWLAGPFGKGLLFGVGLAMAIAAMKEVWELVDLVLLRMAISREGDG